MKFTLGLAPMEGVSDFPTRLWFSAIGDVHFMSTPFLRLTPGMESKKINKLWAPELFDLKMREQTTYHLTPQLMAADAELFSKIGKEVLLKSDLIEINCGCPSPKPVGNGAGSALLHNPNFFATFIGKIVDALPAQKLSVKMRIGFTHAEEFSILLDKIKDFPLNRLVVHGRTKEQGYQGYANWYEIAKASITMPFPVIGSGDIIDLESFNSRTAIAPKLSGAIIGRGALRNPWIFTELKDGKKSTISTEMLLCTLECFARLQACFKQNPEALFSLAKEGVFKEKLTQENWFRLRDNLRKIAPEVDIIGLGRTKMLWHHLKESLDHAYRNPLFLRSKNLSELLEKIRWV